MHKKFKNHKLKLRDSEVANVKKWKSMHEVDRAEINLRLINGPYRYHLQLDLHFAIKYI